MTKGEKVLKIINSNPSQKIGLDDFYGRQTVINMLKEAINYKRCSTELCAYHKMCVRRKINTNICPTNCEDDTRQ